MGIEAGQDVFPEAATLIDDADDLDASNLNNVPEANLDRTRWLFRRLMCVAACFEPSRQQPGGAGGADRLGRGAWNERRKEWFVGFTTAIYATFAGGAAWRGAWSNSGEGVHVAFVNDSLSPRFGDGIGVRCNGADPMHVYTHATDSFVVSGTTMPAAITRWESVLHDPVADTWIALGVNAGAPYVANSPTSAPSFTARTPPAGGIFASSLCSDGNGTVLFQHKALRIAKTVDGGTTWTELVPAFAGTAVTITGLCWDAWRQRFVCVVAKTGGGSEAYVSEDAGVTWTSIGSSAIAALFELVSVGPLVLAVYVPGGSPASAVVSHDGGATWTHTGGFDLVSTLPCMAAGPSDVLVTNTGTDQKGFSFARGFSPSPH